MSQTNEINFVGKYIDAINIFIFIYTSFMELFPAMISKIYNDTYYIFILFVKNYPHRMSVNEFVEYL